jgi:hypothetical protein
MDDETKAFVEDVAKRLDTHYDLWNISDVHDDPDLLPGEIGHGESKRCKLEGNVNDAKVGQTNAKRQNYNDSFVLPISSEFQYCRLNSMMMPPVNFTHDSSTTKMAQLQKELVHAMADKIEAEAKISFLRAEVMVEEAIQARIYQDCWH